MSSSARLAGVLKENVDKVWPEVEKYLSDAVDYSYGKWSLDFLKDSIKNESHQLYVVIDGDVKAAIVTSITQCPNTRILSIDFCGGEGARDWATFAVDELAKWGRAIGCSAIEITGRPGWEKLLGLKKIHVVLRKEL